MVNMFRQWLHERSLARQTGAMRMLAARAMTMLIALVLAGGPARASLYSATDLGPTEMFPDGMGINAAGQVVWTRGVVGQFDRAFLYDGSGMRQLTTPTVLEVVPGLTEAVGGDTVAYGINQSGQVVGFQNIIGNSSPHAILWDSAGIHSLNPLLGDSYSIARAINDAGEVVGYGQFAANFPAQGHHAFLYDGTSMHDLGTLPGDKQSFAYGINSAGQVVGRSGSLADWFHNSFGSSGHAFLSDSTGLHDLGTLPGDDQSIAYGINDAGQVFGISWSNATGRRRPFMYDSAGMHGPGTSWATPGGAAPPPVAMEGTLWVNGAAVDVNSQLAPGANVHLLLVHGINGRGQIVGEGRSDGMEAGPIHAFLLTPFSALPLDPSLTLNATSLPFGAQSVGSPSGSQSVTVTNNGAAPLLLGSLTLSGANPGDFAVTPSATGIAPGGTASLSIVFTPTAAGSRSARLTINSNAPGAPPTIALTGTAAWPAGYVIVDLGVDLGNPIHNDADLFSGPLRLSINAGGVVAGSIPLPNGGSHAAMSDVSGTHDLGTLPDYPNQSLAAGINAADQIVGVSQIDAGNQGHAFLYSGGVMRELDTPGISYIAAHAINDSGSVVGLADGPGQSGAFLYDSSGLHNLGTLGGGPSDAFAINHAGQVVGWSLTADRVPQQHAFLYDSTGMHDLGTLPGGRSSSALAINDAGQIVGESWIGYSWFHAFLYDGAGMRDLGTLGGVGSSAYGINSLGQIVGESYARQGGDPPLHAFLYSGGVMTDLNSLLLPHSAWVLTEADAINDAGQIVGLGTLNGQKHAFLLTFPNDPRVIPPLAPTGLSVKMTSTSERDLAWTDNSDNEHGFEIQRRAAGGDWITVSVTAANVSTYSDTGLSSYAHYAYRIRAVNGAGASEWSNEASGDNGFQGQASLSPGSALDFGGQPVGTPSTVRTVTLTNTGTGPLTIGSITLDGADFAIAAPSCAGAILTPGASCSIDLVFTPTSPGAIVGRMMVTSDGPGSPYQLPLNGNGLAPAVGLSSSLSFDSQHVGTTSGEQSVRLTNTGSAPLTLHGVSIEGSEAGEFDSPDLTEMSDVTLAPGQSRTVTLRFTPAARGSRSAVLVIASNAPDSPARLGLSGTGIAPVVSLSPGSLGFGAQPVGSSNDAQAVTIQNTGDAPLDIRSVTLTGADPGDFVLAADGWTGAHLLPGQIATLNIRFAPTGIGSRTASLTIADNAAGGSQFVPLSGEGTAPLAPCASLSAGSLTFGDQPVGTTSSAQTVALTNSGSAPLTIGAVSFAGANTADFIADLEAGSPTLGPGESRTIAVRFKPTAAGSRVATLVISDSATGSPQWVALSGSGAAPSVTFGISRLAGPGSLSFGSVPLGASSLQTLTLTNSGTAPLAISSLALTGGAAAGYQITADSGQNPLPPGATRTLSLRFTPLTAGGGSAALVISDNAAGGQQSVALTGAGVLPDGHSRGAALIPASGELFIAAVDGTASHSARAVLSVGQSVSVKLVVKFPDGAVADVSGDARCAFGTGAPIGQFTAKSTWSARPQDAGKTVTIYGSYLSPVSRKRIGGTVTVTVRAVRRGRH